MTTGNNHNDLDWLAFSYAAGELDPLPGEQFEARLADDQEAREALARAVEMCQAVTAAEAQHAYYVTPAARTHVRWNDRLSWMAVGGLASLLLALLWTGVIGPTWQTAQLRSFSKQNLAFAWTQTNQEIANVREVGYWSSPLADSSDENTAEISFDDATDDTPSWMTAALLSNSPADSSDGDTGNSDTNS